MNNNTITCPTSGNTLYLYTKDGMKLLRKHVEAVKNYYEYKNNKQSDSTQIGAGYKPKTGKYTETDNTEHTGL
jgi:hypothetical protein